LILIANAVFCSREHRSGNSLDLTGKHAVGISFMEGSQPEIEAKLCGYRKCAFLRSSYRRNVSVSVYFLPLPPVSFKLLQLFL
jgi:hypothetical protein